MDNQAISRHEDGSICPLSLDSRECDHTDHRPCSVCSHKYGSHYVTFDKTWRGCADCNDCEGYVWFDGSVEWEPVYAGDLVYDRLDDEEA